MPSDSEQGKRGFWETIIITTPVLLTVLATLLAGLSNSEMTQAQYKRSLAAQYQSKVTDQWAFFQFKRVRGYNLKLAADALPSWGEKPSAVFPDTVSRLGKTLSRLERQAEQLQKAVSAVGDELGPAGTRLLQAASQVGQAAVSKARDLGDWQKKFGDPFLKSHDEITFLDSQKLPDLPNEAADASQISKFLERARATKDEDVVPTISEEELREAIKKADALAEDFGQMTKSINRAIDAMAPALDELRSIVAGLKVPTQDLAEAEAELPASKTKSLAEVRQLLASVSRSAGAARTLVDDLKANFHAARHEFRALTYDHEARQNKALAELYEVQVRLASQAAERHRHRSRNFFYGMLGAQAAVTVATFALAVRRKSILWSLASAAGLGAVLFGSYVYVYM